MLKLNNKERKLNEKKTLQSIEGILFKQSDIQCVMGAKETSSGIYPPIIIAANLFGQNT